jgi:5-hydroxyisourate hydrolase
MSGISTHVLDTSLGRAAFGVAVLLEVESPNGGWKEAGRGLTNADGRIPDLLKASLERTRYRLTFETAAYFEARSVPCFYPHVVIVFEVRDADQHHHIPLLLSPYGYSTYRGT